MFKRKIAAVLTMMSIFMLVLTGLPTNVSAQSDNIPIMPFWDNTQSISVSMTIDNGAARMTGWVIGNIGTESITVNASLVRLNTNGSVQHIASWTGLEAVGGIWIWDRTHHVARGHTYRLALTATVVLNGVSEVVTHGITVFAH